MRRGNCGAIIGVCALGLGLGILIAAIFPVGALMFLVAFLLIACGEHMLEGREVMCMKIVIWKAPRCLRGLLRRMFGIQE